MWIACWVTPKKGQANSSGEEIEIEIESAQPCTFSLSGVDLVKCSI